MSETPTSRKCQVCQTPMVPLQSPRWGTWRRFCSRSCCGKYASRLLAERLTSADRQRYGREGAAVQRHLYRSALYDKLRDLDRDAAIWTAYKMGRNAAKRARLRTAGGGCV